MPDQRGEVTEATLPPARAFRVTLRAEEPQRVQRFLPTALHGALGDALREMTCAFPSRPNCRGCLVESRCAYPALFDPPPSRDPVLLEQGIRTDTPRPLVLGAEPGWMLGDSPGVTLEAGDEVAVRVSLLGDAVSDLPLVSSALEAAARRGIGLPSARARDRAKARPRMGLVSIEEDSAPGLTPPAGEAALEQVDLELVTPLRLKVNGGISDSPSPREMVRALARRANTVARLRGHLAPLEENAVEQLADQLECIPLDLRRVTVRRWSSRQRSRMELPGVMGILRWRGPTLGRLWALIAWGEVAQVGKGTSMGFGRYRLVRGVERAASQPERPRHISPCEERAPGTP